MKKLYILLLIAVLPIVSKSQTTEEEYNYLTKGYKIQVESGLDMKIGYLIKDYSIKGDYQYFENNVDYKVLVREGDFSYAAMLLIFKDSNTGVKTYMCIPNYYSFETIWDRAYSDWNKLEGFNEKDWALVRIISNLFSEAYKENDHD